MIVHASYRGDHVLEALTEILTAMAALLVDNAFCRVDLVGKSNDQRRKVVDEADTQTMLVHGLNRFIAGVLGREDMVSMRERKPGGRRTTPP